MWIDDDMAAVGDVGFLVERVLNNHGGVSKFQRWDTPAHTNQSHEPRLDGWCGETNNVSVYARGMVRVTKIASNGRARVVALKGSELSQALLDAGYPELDPTGEAERLDEAAEAVGVSV